MLNNYDRIAAHYDLFSRMVFGRSLLKAQTCLLQYLKPDSAILIIGGGTGQILEEIGKCYPQGLAIDYVEISGNMIALARKKDREQNQVDFIQQAIEDFCPVRQYDFVLSFFLFDNFTALKAQSVFDKVNKMLKQGGAWLFADFFYTAQKGKLWQKILLKSMYLFFRFTCNIEASSLVNMEFIFVNSGYTKIHETTSYGGFIKSVAYLKPE